MADLSTELLKVILNVLGVGLWGITIVYLIIIRLKKNQANFEHNNKEDIIDFSDELMLQTMKNQSEKAVEAVSDRMHKGSQRLHRLTEKADIRKANQFWEDFKDEKKPGMAGGYPVGDEYGRIIKLANMGLSAKEVSERVKMPKGEVELVIKLRRQNYGYSGNSTALHA